MYLLNEDTNQSFETSWLNLGILEVFSFTFYHHLILTIFGTGRMSLLEEGESSG